MSSTTAPYQANPNWYNIRTQILSQGNTTIPYPVSSFLFPSFGSANSSSSSITQLNTTNSISSSTGATIITGGMGLSGKISLGGTLSILGTGDSSSTTSGAFLGTGTISLSKNLFVGGSTRFSGTAAITNISSDGTVLVFGSLYGATIYSSGVIVPPGYISGLNLSVNSNIVSLNSSWGSSFTINGQMNSNIDTFSVSAGSANLQVSGSSNTGPIFQGAGGINTGGSFNVSSTSRVSKIIVGASLISSSFPLNVASGTGNTPSATNGYLGLGGLSTNSTSSATASFSSGILVSGEIDVTSDIRNKTNIYTIEGRDALESLLALTPVEFDWKDKLNNRIGRISGFIAQDVLEVVPNAVTLTKSQFVANIYLLSTYQKVLGSETSQVKYQGDDVKEGSVVRLFMNGISEDTTVLGLNDTHFFIHSPTTWNPSGDVFIYGIQVDDFHHFQPEQLIALNVGAIQRLDELYSELKVKIENFK